LNSGLNSAAAADQLQHVDKTSISARSASAISPLALTALGNDRSWRKAALGQLDISCAVWFMR
jgi:hypothetical protein